MKKTIDPNDAQIIFCNLDAVLGSLFTGMLKAKFGTIQVIHQIRQNEDPTSQLDDATILSSALKRGRVVSTCWNVKRTRKALRQLNLTLDEVRLYSIGYRVRAQDLTINEEQTNGNN